MVGEADMKSHGLSLGVGVAALGVLLWLTSSPALGQTFMSLGEVAYVDYAGLAPGGAYPAPGANETYLQVSIGERRLRVMRGAEVLHEFPVAVGKGAYLRHRDAENGGWLFETPVGVFSVGRRETDPVWYAPDWFYVEKGWSVPAADSPKRYFPGEMGKFALYLGDGLAIHGTKVKDSVGRAASHGCMRLSDEGISTIFSLTKIGTTVIITP